MPSSSIFSIDSRIYVADVLYCIHILSADLKFSESLTLSFILRSIKYLPFNVYSAAQRNTISMLLFSVLCVDGGLGYIHSATINAYWVKRTDFHAI